MKTAVALGSNIGDRLQNLRLATQSLRTLTSAPGSFRTSFIYESDPLDCPPGSPVFMNAVVDFDYSQSAEQLLKSLQQIEVDMGRPDQREKNSPRTIDLDILYFGDEVSDNPALTLPHPRIGERKFVLMPLADLSPQLTLPDQQNTVTELLASTIDDSAITKLSDSLLL